MLAPGFLTMKAQGYERLRQETLQQNLVQMRAAGIEDASNFFFRSNEESKGKGVDKRKKKIGHGDDDEDYEPFNGEEGQNYEDENDDSSTYQAKKVKSTEARKKNACSTPQEEGISPQESTQALQLPTSPTAQTMFEKPKRKRGPTKLKTIAIDGGSRVEVQFDECGLPISDGSMKLSSFLGPLVREVVPYTLSDWRRLPTEMAKILWQSVKARFKLDQEWERQQVLKQMAESWRASKSRLVKQVRDAKNVEERLQLRPDCIKSVHDWNDFVKEKTSKKFQEKSDGFKKIRKKKLPHTMSRKGYARLRSELKAKSADPSSVTRVKVWTEGHKRRKGAPVNTEVDQTIKELEKVEQDTPKSSSTNLKEDVLSKVLGPERGGRVRTFGKGVTLQKLAIISQVNSRTTQLEEGQVALKAQVAHMQNVISELQKNQNHATKEGPTMPIVSPVSVNPAYDAKCKLLDWMGTGEVVAEGRWSSSDPNALVHHVPIGPGAMRVWVDVAMKRGQRVHLWRRTDDMTQIDEALGSTVAWPADKVIFASSPESID